MPKISGLPELQSIAGDDEIAIVDTSETTTKKVSASALFGVNTGWVSAGETWTYSTYSSTTRIAEITVATNAELRYTVGMRVRFDQTTDGTKYGIIHKIDSTTLHIFMHEDYDVDNEAITENYVSRLKAPIGFDLNKEKWQVLWQRGGSVENETTGLTAYQQIGTVQLTIGVGAWDLMAYIQWEFKFTSSTRDMNVALSTTTTAVSDTEMYARHYLNATSTSAQTFHIQNWFGKPVLFTAEDTVYIIGRIASGGTEIEVRAGSLIRATSGYL